MFRYLSQEACRLDTGSSHNGHHAMATFEGRVLKVASDAQHGFSKRANRVKYLRAVARFLHERIG